MDTESTTLKDDEILGSGLEEDTPGDADGGDEDGDTTDSSDSDGSDGDADTDDA